MQTLRQYLLYTLHNTVCTRIWLDLQEERTILLTPCDPDSFQVFGFHRLHLGHMGLSIWMQIP